MQNVSTALKIISALLITGGFTGTWTRKIQYNSAEVWAPAVDGAGTFHCNLPSMKKYRYYHTLTTRSGGAPLVCGGGDGGINLIISLDGDITKTCEQYNNSNWQLLSARPMVGRYSHSDWWDNTTGITYLMGGTRNETSVEIISTSGAGSTIDRAFWTMKNKTK